MYPEALHALTDPRNPADRLELEPGARAAADGAVRRGRLRAAGSGQRYPIHAGIADFVNTPLLLDSPAQMVNSLPPTAWAYERLWRHRSLTLLTGEPFGYQRELPLIIGLLAPERGGLYLDVACSNGLYARSIDRVLAGNGHVVGIDHALPMLKQARSFAGRGGHRISYVCSKAQALPFPDGAAAGVAIGGSLNEIGDLHGCLREARRVIAPTGRFVVMSLVQADRFAGQALQQALSPGGIEFRSLDDVNHEFARAGWHLTAQWRYGVVVFSLLLPYRPARPVPVTCPSP
jgi:SAM-dependent methyltransferase